MFQTDSPVALTEAHNPVPCLCTLSLPGTPSETSTSLAVLTENDLPARLEDLTTSVTLTFRHVWSATGVAVGGQRAVPETE